MNRTLAILLLLAIAVTSSGCGTLRKFTKKNDNTVLPGQREEILSPDQYKVEDTTVSGGAQKPEDAQSDAPCDPNVDSDCSPAIDQEGG